MTHRRRRLSTRPTAWSGIVALAVFSYGCAAPAAVSKAESQRSADESHCVPVEALSTWEALDDRTIVLVDPEAESGYLLKLTAPILGLSFAEEIDVVDTDLDGFVCANGGDGIVIPECGCDSTTVATIKLLSKKRLMELLAPRPVTTSI